VIDYTKEDFVNGGASYDLILDAVGKVSKSTCKKALAPGGKFVSVLTDGKETLENLVFLKEVAEAGNIKAIIDRSYALEQIIEAHRYVDTGRKKGNVVITLD
jgi:NADPH:quinone reductase-like Zn-dependent oxidoreductase